jgi:hypothetical protein
MKATDNGKHQRDFDKLILADLKNDERIMAPAPGRRLENDKDVGEEGGNDKFEEKKLLATYRGQLSLAHAGTILPLTTISKTGMM